MRWLDIGKPFPPTAETPRIRRYCQNEQLFYGDHFADSQFTDVEYPFECTPISVYQQCADRIEQVIGNFQDIISFPVLLNYQRLMSIKTADLICGEPPAITSSSTENNKLILAARARTDFDSKLYATAIDLSRFGDAIWRTFKDDDGEYNFTCWDPKQWYPIIRQDGTNRIKAHCIAWRENVSPSVDYPEWQLHVQEHGNMPEDYGHYTHYTFRMDDDGTYLVELLDTQEVNTGLDKCAVAHLRPFATSTSVFGFDDYVQIDSILAEIMERIGQISVILDKHADPSMAGPQSMLNFNVETGEYYLKTGKYFAYAPGEEPPGYLVWNGQLDAAFKQLDLLINQLYILSEMGDALLGGGGDGGQAISGSAMRFKMVSPLAKVRRLANSLRIPVKKLFDTLTSGGVPYDQISIEWFDGLPDDPRENAEIAKIVTGATKMMPLKIAIREYFNRTDEEAEEWYAAIMEENPQPDQDPNKPGPQDGTGINPAKKGSETGLQAFHGLNNK